MRVRIQKQRRRTATIVDVLAMILVLFFLAYLLLPYLARPMSEGIQMNCVRNLKQISVGFITWAGDHNGEYPMSYSPKIGGGLEWPATTNIAVYFRTASNELSTQQILWCPADVDRLPATNWTTDNSHISYFLNLDANKAHPQEIMVGDDNWALDDMPVKSGLFLLSTNLPISWTAGRHQRGGNIAFSDGSVAEEPDLGLQKALQLSVQQTGFQLSSQRTGVLTNRIVIP